MGLTVQKKFFERREQVFEDLAQTGHWPTTFVSGASPELPHIPRGTLHAEGAVVGEVIYIVGTETPGSLRTQLALLDPKDPARGNGR